MSRQIQNRLRKLRGELARNQIDALFVSQPENRYYLSGFDGSAGFLLITENKLVLAADFRYIEQSKIQAPDYEIFRITGEIAHWFSELTADPAIKSLGFESEHITFVFFQQLKDGLNKKKSTLKLVPVTGLVESLRTIKEPEEIDLISRAAQLGDQAFEHIEGIIQAGMTEKEIAWELEKFMREHGSQGMPFDIIVASGASSAMPHARPDERAINTGEPIVIDMGTSVEGGYSSDMTRTIFLGDQDDAFKRIYDIVLGAQLTAIATIKEGMTGEQADSLARTVIQQAGYGEAFGHGLGHGVGLATHELPRLAPRSTDVISSGMVFTIEPGIYLPGWGGVRIEDMVLIENGKPRVLTHARKT